MFVLDKLSLPRLLFARKAKAYLSGAPSGAKLKEYALNLSSKQILDKDDIVYRGTNALAYLSTNDEEKSLLRWHLVGTETTKT